MHIMDFCAAAVLEIDGAGLLVTATGFLAVTGTYSIKGLFTIQTYFVRTKDLIFSYTRADILGSLPVPFLLSCP